MDEIIAEAVAYADDLVLLSPSLISWFAINLKNFLLSLTKWHYSLM